MIEAERDALILHEAAALRPAPRWGALLAGVFLTLAILVLLGEIGAAIGLSAFDRGDDARPFVIGAGILGAVMAIVAFFAGGYASGVLSGRCARRDGIWQGLLVWAVAVPVIGVLGAMLALGSATASAATATAASAAATAAETARPGSTGDAAARAADRAEDAAVAARPETVETAAKAAGAVGWAMVLGLLLSAAAAIAGGVVGARRDVVVVEHRERDHDTRAAVA
jgi:hypothetical protein